MSEPILPPMGGTDIMFNRLMSEFPLADMGVKVIKSVCDERHLEDGVKNVLWQHLSYDQDFVAGMRDKFFMSAIDAFVYVSHWQHEKFRYIFNTPLDRSFVLRNAIDPIEYTPRPRGDKVRIIYASAPFRGLNILVDAISMLNRHDYELHVYSSPLMYGTEWANTFGAETKPLLDHVRTMPNVVMHDYQPNSVVVEAMRRADIFAYPSIFEETSCLSMIEAGAAGCMLLTTNFGALPETGIGYNRMVEIRADHMGLVKAYAAALNQAIDDALDGYDGAQQSAHFNDVYSWSSRRLEWQRFFETLLA